MSLVSKRGVRTIPQTSAAWIIADAISTFVHHLNAHQFGVVVGLLTILGAWTQDLVETRRGSGLLRDTPEK